MIVSIKHLRFGMETDAVQGEPQDNNLLAPSEQLSFDSVTDKHPSDVENHCLYQCYIDLKWVKQWTELEFKVCRLQGIFHHYYVIGKHQNEGKYHKVIPIPIHHELSIKR